MQQLAVSIYFRLFIWSATSHTLASLFQCGFFISAHSMFGTFDMTQHTKADVLLKSYP